MEPIWRAFYTKPRHERKAAARLAEQGIDVYCPVFKTKVRWSDRWKKVTKPLFNGYIFAQVDEAERLMVLEDPSVSRCVMYVGKPATVRDEEIRAIKVLLEDAEDVQIREFEPGSRVTIQGGHLAGTEGEVIVVNGGQARLRIEALGRELVATVKVKELERELP
jgi:transcription antitermination factor NusG